MPTKSHIQNEEVIPLSSIKEPPEDRFEMLNTNAENERPTRYIRAEDYQTLIPMFRNGTTVAAAAKTLELRRDVCARAFRDMVEAGELTPDQIEEAQISKLLALNTVALDTIAGRIAEMDNKDLIRAVQVLAANLAALRAKPVAIVQHELRISTMDLDNIMSKAIAVQSKIEDAEELPPDEDY